MIYINYLKPYVLAAEAEIFVEVNASCIHWPRERLRDLSTASTQAPPSASWNESVLWSAIFEQMALQTRISRRTLLAAFGLSSSAAAEQCALTFGSLCITEWCARRSTATITAIAIQVWVWSRSPRPPRSSRIWSLLGGILLSDIAVSPTPSPVPPSPPTVNAVTMASSLTAPATACSPRRAVASAFLGAPLVGSAGAAVFGRAPSVTGRRPAVRVPAGRPAAATHMVAEPETSTIVIDENIADFCSVDSRTGKRVEMSVPEKEALFLSAMNAYFNKEPALLSDSEFDALKEELTWQGSDVVTLSRDEFRFLDAAKSFDKGKSVMSDEEFDELKMSLRRQGSVVAVARGPRCSIERQITFSEVIPDTKRIIALYLPAAALGCLLWLSGSYELTPLRNVDPVLSLLLGTPLIYLFSRTVTQLVVPSPLILVGDCPSCGRQTRTFFGKVLSVDGFQEEATVKCDKCSAKLKVEKDSLRMVLLEEGKEKAAARAGR